MPRIAEAQGRFMTHLGVEEVLAYIQEKVPEEVSFRVETHLAECRECAAAVRLYFSLKDRFDEEWEDWAAARTAEKAIRGRLAEACTRVGSDPALRERIVAWFGLLSRRTRGAVEVVLDAPRKTVRASGARLERIFAGEGILRFAPMPLPTRVRGEGQADKALLSAPGPPWVRVTVEGRARKISVQHQHQDRPWPLVSLIPRGEGVPMVREYRTPPDADFLLAEFEDVPDGDYLLLFEGPGAGP